MTDNILEKLSKSLSQEEMDDGWTENSRQAMLKFFGSLKNDLEKGVDVSVKAEYRSIARGMDHWGIGEGELLKEATEISEVIRSL